MKKKYKVKLLGKLERDILKYRSYETMVFLFYAEDLRRFIIQSLEATNIIHGISNEGLKIKHHLKRLVNDGVLTKDEKHELHRLLCYRNDTAHEIHNIVSDLGEAKSFLIPDKDGNIKSKYDAGALFRLKVLTTKISPRVSKPLCYARII
ncbi:hypothetical protein NX773_11890 [Massilia solisilvae]|uniref:DUF4145 domain-containing protein n=1 Tax=Massilia solisilvae TaxID=1811225 RepID=A0ABT2BKC8_9BURK|nr:hypothetical protein [Massilia solisilvae]MCS0608866.1 hypothetical protein [Massilia solisilvae]